MSKFKKGDRVYYKDDITDTGTVLCTEGDFCEVYWDLEDVKLTIHDELITSCNPLDSYTIPEIIAHFKYENILDEMNKDEVMHYLIFGK